MTPYDYQFIWGRSLRASTENIEKVTAVKFTPDYSKLIITTSRNYLIIVMDALDGTILGKYGFLPSNSLSNNAFTPPFGI